MTAVPERLSRLTPAEARQIAGLHEKVIREGFLTQLGTPFLTQMYRAFAADPGVCLIVARDQGRIVGFACTALDLPQTYRRFIRTRGMPAAAAAARTLAKPSALRRAVETFRAARVGDDSKGGGSKERLPVLMNLCVDPPQQRKGLGREMLKETARWLAANRKETFIAVTGESQASAVHFYRGLGATEQGKTNVHAGARSHRFTVPVTPLLSS